MEKTKYRTVNNGYWDILQYLVEIQGKFIGFNWVETTGDESAEDLGWTPDINSICFCEPVEVTITKYKRI